MVIWLMGISGAGKTTIGHEIKKHLKNAYMIDGDEMRKFFNNDLGYSSIDREANMKRFIVAAHVLDQNDVCTIICCISAFQKHRDFCREKIPGYNEIYLKRDISSSIKNDVKKMYAENKGKTEIIGIDIVFDEPTNPDLILETDKLSIDETIERLTQYLIKKYGTEIFIEGTDS
jgi:adenylylsulfate kinase